MRKRHVLVLLAVCMLMVGLTASGALGAEERSQVPTLNVSGTGTVTVTPDEATVSFSVVTTNSSAAGAILENARKTNAAIQALARLGITRDNLMTTSFQIWPEYNYDEKREKPEIIGYRVQNQLMAKVEPEKVGTIIDTAVEAGVNQVNSISFSKKDIAEASKEALRKACQEARAKAEALADALGVQLVSVMTVNESQYWGELPVYRYDLASVGGQAATPIIPSEVRVTSTVSIVYVIK